jgi:peptide deformylase
LTLFHKCITNAYGHFEHSRIPDPRLRTIAKPVAESTTPCQLVDDMFETMYEAPGILAATQVNVHKRIVVMDLSEDAANRACSSTPSSKS